MRALKKGSWFGLRFLFEMLAAGGSAYYIDSCEVDYSRNLLGTFTEAFLAFSCNWTRLQSLFRLALTARDHSPFLSANAAHLRKASRSYLSSPFPFLKTPQQQHPTRRDNFNPRYRPFILSDLICCLQYLLLGHRDNHTLFDASSATTAFRRSLSFLDPLFPWLQQTSTRPIMSSPPSFVSDALIVTRDALIASIRDLLEKIVVAERTRSPQQHSKTLEVLSEQTRKTKDVIRHKVYLKTILDGYDKASLTSGNVVEPAAWEKDLPRLFSQDVLARRLAERLGNISNIVLPVTEVAWQRSPEEDSQSEDGSIDDEEGSDNDTEDEDSIAPNGYIRLVNFKRDELIIPLSPRSAATWPRVHPASKNLTRIKAARRSVPLSRTLSPNLLPLKPPQEVCMDPASLLAISLAEEQSKKKAELHKNSAKRVGSPTLLIEEAPSTKKARAHRIGNRYKNFIKCNLSQS